MCINKFCSLVRLKYNTFIGMYVVRAQAASLTEYVRVIYSNALDVVYLFNYDYSRRVYVLVCHLLVHKWRRS